MWVQARSNTSSDNIGIIEALVVQALVRYWKCGQSDAGNCAWNVFELSLLAIVKVACVDMVRSLMHFEMRLENNSGRW